MSALVGYKKYLSKEAEKGVEHFQYKGGSDSILYTYLWSPMADWLCYNVCPDWVAPNLITFSGFVLAIISHITIIYYSYPNFDKGVPVWVSVQGGISIIIYQILDNIDGKQARRTGNSSPLGMLFDHGCDSVTTWMLASQHLGIIGGGNGGNMFIVVIVSSFLTFYSAHWSQYHVGQFRLSKINAIDEGLILCWGSYFVTAIYGVEIWQRELINGISMGHVFLYFSGMLAVMQNIYFLIDTIIKSWGKKSFFIVIYNQTVSLILVATMIVLVYFSPSNITATPLNYFIIASLGFSYSKITLHLQIAHIAEEKKDYSQFRASYLFICFSYIINTLCGYFFGQTPVSEQTLPIFLLVISLYQYVHTAVCVIIQMCDILKIRVFKVKPKSLKSN